MLHSQEPSPHVAAPAPLASQWVRCRSRVWKVLDARQTTASTVWRLTGPSEVLYAFATPPDIVEPLERAPEIVSRRHWMRAMARALRTSGPVWWPSAASRLPIATLPFQYVAAMAMLSGHHRRVLLADEVGMGKTIQAAILLHHLHLHAPAAASLIVVPASLVGQWVDELRTRAHVDPVVLDAVALRREASQPAALIDASRAGTCWIVSIDLLRQPEIAALLDRCPWSLVVVDEAHLAAPGTARLEAVSRVAAVSVRLLLLTATPHAGGTAGGTALRAIGARAGEPPMLVLHRRATLLQRPQRRLHIIRARLSAAHLDLCRRLDRYVATARADAGGDGLLAALVLRRRASSCPAALIRSLQRRLIVLGEGDGPSTAPTQTLFDEPDTDADGQDDEVMRIGAWRDEREERDELEAILALARKLPPAGGKLQAVSRLVCRLREPVVVFTAYIDTLRTLRDCLPPARIVVVHGQQPGPLREHALRTFTTGEADVLLTTDASAEGLNLHTRCRVIVHAEVPASARTFLQRTGRVDRYGQVRRVHAFVFSSDTTDDQDASVRLASRQDEGERWLADVSTRHCRRTALAERRLAVGRGRIDPAPDTSHDDVADRTADGGRAMVCRVRARTWWRLAARSGMPATAHRLSIAMVRVRGGPPLSACDVPVAIVERRGSRDDVIRCGVTHHPSLRAPLARIGRLVARLREWERNALQAHAHAQQERVATPGLFDDSGAGRGQHAQEMEGARLHVTTDVIGVLERRR